MLKRRVTLQLSRDSGRTFGLALLFFLVLAALLESLARTRAVQAWVPFQAYGTNQIQFEVQLNNFQTYLKHHEAPDCIILGTSQSLRGIEPQTLAQAYRSQTGVELVCYNFSVIGANVSTTLLLSEFLIRNIHPRLFILGTSYLDYTQGREDRWDPRFDENAWLDYQLGQPSLKGWLYEHSYAFRLLNLFSYSAPYGLHMQEVLKEAKKWSDQLSESGYAHTKSILPASEPLTPNFLEGFIYQFGDFTISTWNIESLEKVIDLARQNGVQVVVVEMPCHPSLSTLKDRQQQVHPEKARVDQFVSQVNAQLSAIAGSYQVPYWETGHLGFFPEDGWKDRYHFNDRGSPVFTTWLAQQLAQAVARGQIDDPSSWK